MVSKNIPDVVDVYPLALKIALFITILSFITSFVLFGDYEPPKFNVNKGILVQEVIDIDPPKNFEEIKPPKRPPIPRQVFNPDEEDESSQIIENSIEKEWPVPLPPPPPPPPPIPEQPKIYEVVEDYPQPLRLMVPEYPEMARMANLEGTVFLEIVVGIDGRVKEAVVKKSLQSGPGGCDEAAINAAMASIFIPGKQQNKPVAVRIIFPVKFSLE